MQSLHFLINKFVLRVETKIKVIIKKNNKRIYEVVGTIVKFANCAPQVKIFFSNIINQNWLIILNSRWKAHYLSKTFDTDHT